MRKLKTNLLYLNFNYLRVEVDEEDKINKSCISLDNLKNLIIFKSCIRRYVILTFFKTRKCFLIKNYNIVYLLKDKNIY